MIFRRLAHSIRQNRFTMILEILVVAIGIVPLGDGLISQLGANWSGDQHVRL
jgi:hypothetical protein